MGISGSRRRPMPTPWREQLEKRKMKKKKTAEWRKAQTNLGSHFEETSMPPVMLSLGDDRRGMLRG